MKFTSFPAAAPNVAPTGIYNPASRERRILENGIFLITAVAADIVGTIEQVELLVDNASVERQPKYLIPLPGFQPMPANTAHNCGCPTTTMAAQQPRIVNITVTPAPSSRRHIHNGDFSYEFSPTTTTQP